MRLVVACAALALAAAASAQPVTTAPLGAREVLLEIDAIGSVRTPADKVALTAQLQAAATAAEARAALAALEQRVIAAAVAGGIAREDIGAPAPIGLMGLAGNDAMAAAMAAGQANPGEQSASKSLEVRIRDAATIERIRAALEAAGAQVTGPFYFLTNDDAARQAASARGLAQARAEAEPYARALNMRIGRIVRVSERPTIESASLDMADTMMRRMMGNAGVDPEIETRVRVAVDFALVPQ